MRDGPSPYLFHEFERRLLETVAWCDVHGDPAAPGTSLRTAALDPGVCFAAREPAPWSGETREFRSLEDEATVERLALARREQLSRTGRSVADHPPDLSGGRILLFQPHETLWTQACHPASRGFFELRGDLPPWDTWVAYLTAPRHVLRESWTKAGVGPVDHLVCWVPRAFVGWAENGLEASEILLGTWVEPTLPLRSVHAALLRSLGDEGPAGIPLRLDPDARSRRPDEPAFLASPPGSPAYHGFSLVEATRTDGWCYGAITEFEDPEGFAEGDGFVEAPDGSRAGIAWSVGTYETRMIVQPDSRRWGVYAVAFPTRIRDVADLTACFRSVLPDLQRMHALHRRAPWWSPRRWWPR